MASGLPIPSDNKSCIWCGGNLKKFMRLTNKKHLPVFGCVDCDGKETVDLGTHPLKPLG